MQTAVQSGTLYIEVVLLGKTDDVDFAWQQSIQWEPAQQSHAVVGPCQYCVLKTKL